MVVRWENGEVLVDFVVERDDTRMPVEMIFSSAHAPDNKGDAVLLRVSNAGLDTCCFCCQPEIGIGGGVAIIAAKVNGPDSSSGPWSACICNSMYIQALHVGDRLIMEADYFSIKKRTCPHGKACQFDDCPVICSLFPFLFTAVAISSTIARWFFTFDEGRYNQVIVINI